MNEGEGHAGREVQNDSEGEHDGVFLDARAIQDMELNGVSQAINALASKIA